MKNNSNFVGTNNQQNGYGNLLYGVGRGNGNTAFVTKADIEQIIFHPCVF